MMMRIVGRRRAPLEMGRGPVGPVEPVFAPRTLGERMADRVAAVGGSWAFIGGFGCFLLVWAGVNWAAGPRAFDPFPFVFLNLVLSMLAALQAPVIMMSQNRQAAADRLEARQDHETNQRTEAEIAALHAKVDALGGQVAALVAALGARELA